MHYLKIAKLKALEYVCSNKKSLFILICNFGNNILILYCYGEAKLIRS